MCVEYGMGCEASTEGDMYSYEIFLTRDVLGEETHWQNV